MISIHYGLFCSMMVSLVIGLSMSPEDYRRLVMKRCYNQTERYEPLILGQKKPIGLSVDYFVSLLDKIEKRLPHLTTLDVITLILKRFHYDGVKMVTMNLDFQQIQNQWEANHRIMIETLTIKNNPGIVSNFSEFPEDILTEDEKCSLFFMISHSINKTEINELGDPVIKEFGIVSLLNNQNFAIAMNSVLMGIWIGLQNVQSQTINLLDPFMIDPLFAFTLSDKLARASIQNIIDSSGQSSFFGSGGTWNSTYCQTEHRLPAKDGDIVTLAEINGAIDGWLIGQKLRLDSEFGHTLRNLKLSELIEKYYSKNGLSPDCGICSTGLYSNDVIYDVKENAKNFGFMWNKNFNQDNFEYERIAGYIEAYSQIYSQFIEKSLESKRLECSQLRNSDISSINYDTKTDLYIMIDNNANQYSKYQLETITKLLVRMKSLEILGNVTILVNAHKGFDSELMSTKIENLREPLHLITYNSNSIQKATCRIAWYPYRETTIKNMKLLLNNLVQFFDQDNITNTDKGRSKNFIWFSLKQNSYERLTERERIYYYQSRWYLLFNLNVRTFFISNYEQKLDNDMSELMLNKYDWHKVNPMDMNDRITVDRLVHKLSETPIPVRLEHCGNKKADVYIEDNMIDITKKQTWALYPKYFLDSQRVHIKFESPESRIRVCLGRWQFPELNRTQCQETNTVAESIEFYVNQPCPWKIIESCWPIYFTVVAVKNELNKFQGFEGHTIHRAAWTVSYEGLTCSQNGTHLPVLNFFLVFVSITIISIVNIFK